MVVLTPGVYCHAGEKVEEKQCSNPGHMKVGDRVTFSGKNGIWKC